MESPLTKVLLMYKDLHYLTRATQAAHKAATQRFQWTPAAYELVAAFTQLRLAQWYLKDYLYALSDKFNQDIPGMEENDPLPETRDISKVLGFLLRELERLLDESRKAPAEAYFADARVLSAYNLAFQRTRESMYLIQLAKEYLDETSSQITPRSGGLPG